MLTRQHRQECISLAFVHALAGQAGVNVTVNRVFDYGVDGTLHPITVRNNRRVESGFNVDFQLKSTVNWSIDDDSVVYDLEAKTYNDLVTREPGADGCVLILLCLPRDEADWLVGTDAQLVLRHCCYWAVITGPETDRAQTTRVRIPRVNLLTAEAIATILEQERARRMGQ